MGRAATRDVVDAAVAQTAADLQAVVVTGDRAHPPPPPSCRRDKPDHRPIATPDQPRTPPRTAQALLSP